MTVSYIGHGVYAGASSDTKPTTGVVTGAIFLENNTGFVYYYSGSAWTVGATAGGGGAGEANTYSTSGTGLAWTQTKSGVNLPFRSLIAGSTKLTATQNTNDITLDINQANLALSSLGDVNTTGRANGDSLKWDTSTSKWIIYTPSAGGSGETNTMSNLTGTAGAVGIYKQKTGVNFEMKKINAGSANITITDDTTNNEVDIDIGSNVSTASSTTTLSNKTITLASNTVTDTSAATGDITRYNGTRFVRMGRGTALQVLRTNSAGTDIEYASLNSENAGTATASGNNATTVFNIAHSLGSTPYMAHVQCSSLTTAFTYTYNSTNIVVTFATAPATGTNNIVFQWRAIL